MWLSVVVFGEDVCTGFLPLGRKTLHFYLSEAVMRNGDSDLDSPKVHGPCRRLIGPGGV